MYQLIMCILGVLLMIEDGNGQSDSSIVNFSKDKQEITIRQMLDDFKRGCKMFLLLEKSSHIIPLEVWMGKSILEEKSSVPNLGKYDQFHLLHKLGGFAEILQNVLNKFNSNLQNITSNFKSKRSLLDSMLRKQPENNSNNSNNSNDDENNDYMTNKELLKKLPTICPWFDLFDSFLTKTPLGALNIDKLPIPTEEVAKIQDFMNRFNEMKKDRQLQNFM